MFTIYCNAAALPIYQLNCAQKVSVHLQIVRYIKNWNIMWKWNAFMKSAVFFCAFWHLLHCSAMLFGQLMGTHIGQGWIFKVAKAPVQSRFKWILAHASQKTILKLNGRLRNFSKSKLSHSMIHNYAKQHRIATHEVKMHRRKLRFSCIHLIFTYFSFWFIWQFVSVQILFVSIYFLLQLNAMHYT